MHTHPGQGPFCFLNGGKEEISGALQFYLIHLLMRGTRAYCVQISASSNRSTVCSAELTAKNPPIPNVFLIKGLTNYMMFYLGHLRRNKNYFFKSRLNVCLHKGPR